MRQQTTSSGKKTKIIALDDDLVVRTLFASILENDYDLLLADSAKSFNELFTASKPDIVILDVVLPDGNGIDICREIRNTPEGNDLVILVLTASDTMKTIDQAYEAGADDYIRKPFVTSELLAKIANFGKTLDALNSLREKNRLYINEVNNIKTIQSSIIPVFSEVRGYDIDYYYLPASDLSGDFFDGFYLDEHNYQLVICDVSGHGITSSYLGNQIRTMFRMESRPGGGPAETVDRVNSIFAREMGSLGYFCTAILCLIDTLSGVIRICSAGHPEALLLTVEKEIVKISSTGPLVGVNIHAVYREHEIILKPDEHMLLYTDGITEACMPEREMFGEKRLVAAFREFSSGTPRQTLEALVSEVYSFTDYHDQEDDITAICVKRL